MIVAPFNSFAEAVVDELEKNGVKSVVITNSEKQARHLYLHSKLAIVGDITNVDLLYAAGLQNAGRWCSAATTLRKTRWRRSR